MSYSLSPRVDMLNSGREVDKKQVSLLDGAAFDIIKLSPQCSQVANKPAQPDQSRDGMDGVYTNAFAKVEDGVMSESHAAHNGWQDVTADSGDDAEALESCNGETRTGRHVCSVCGTSFTMLGNLNRHKKSHMNVRPYNCNFCTRGFLRRTSYIEHVRLHTGEKPYACRVCGQSFVRRKCFQTHAKSCPGSMSSTSAPGSSTLVDGGAQEHGYDDTASCGRSGSYSPLAVIIGESTLPVPSASSETAAARQGSLIGSNPTGFLPKMLMHRQSSGIGRTSFSIMKKARSTQLSRWKKHCSSLLRQSAAVDASSAGLLSRRAIVEGRRRPVSRSLPDAAGDAKAGQLPRSDLSLLPSDIPVPKVLTVESLQASSQRGRQSESSTHTIISPTASHIATAVTAAAATPRRSVVGSPPVAVSNGLQDVKLFHCRHCDIYFANQVTFLLHRGLHGEGDPLKCSICGKVCKDANEFLIHH